MVTVSASIVRNVAERRVATLISKVGRCWSLRFQKVVCHSLAAVGVSEWTWLDRSFAL